MKGSTTFHFVTGGMYEALDRAREAAQGKDVRIGDPAREGRAPVREARCASAGVYMRRVCAVGTGYACGASAPGAQCGRATLSGKGQCETSTAVLGCCGARPPVQQRPVGCGARHAHADGTRHRRRCERVEAFVTFPPCPSPGASTSLAMERAGRVEAGADACARPRSARSRCCATSIARGSAPDRTGDPEHAPRRASSGRAHGTTNRRNRSPIALISHYARSSARGRVSGRFVRKERAHAQALAQ